VEKKLLPELVLPATIKDEVNIPKDLEGRWSLIYFYPKDDTPGCTVQACSYRDSLKTFVDSGIDVYGVSFDDLPSHYNFESKYELNFPLLYDSKKELGKFFGVVEEYREEGKKKCRVARDTFLVNPYGQVVKSWRGVDPKTTAQTTLKEALDFI